MPPPGEAADPYCLRGGEGAALLAGHPWRRFVVLGDSVAEGLGEAVPGYGRLSWTDRIAAELTATAPALLYRNLGQRGLRAAEVRERQLDDALALGPDLALVVCGGNDAFSALYDPDAVDGELRALVAALQDQGAEVITVGMFDISASPAVPDWLRPGLAERLRTLAERTAAIAAGLGTLHVHLTSHPLSRDPSLYSSDGRHGNARSHAVAAAETVRRLGAHLEAARPG